MHLNERYDRNERIDSKDEGVMKGRTFTDSIIIHNRKRSPERLITLTSPPGGGGSHRYIRWGDFHDSPVSPVD
jgi:hypothetical protein